MQWKRRYDDWFRLTSLLDKNLTLLANVQPKEIKEYEFERKEPANCDANSVYWNDRSRWWPRLVNIAQDILSIPATSGASERAFSAEKNAFGLVRMSNRPAETVEALICLESG